MNGDTLRVYEDADRTKIYGVPNDADRQAFAEARAMRLPPDGLEQRRVWAMARTFPDAESLVGLCHFEAGRLSDMWTRFADLYPELWADG